MIIYAETIVQNFNQFKCFQISLYFLHVQNSLDIIQISSLTGLIDAVRIDNKSFFVIKRESIVSSVKLSGKKHKRNYGGSRSSLAVVAMSCNDSVNIFLIQEVLLCKNYRISLQIIKIVVRGGV